jgi:hypothetical protein
MRGLKLIESINLRDIQHQPHELLKTEDKRLQALEEETISSWRDEGSVLPSAAYGSTRTRTGGSGKY